MIPVIRRRREFEASSWKEELPAAHTLGPTLGKLLEEIAGLEHYTAIDVGCGRGRLALHLAPRVKRVVGIDRDRDEIELAKKRATELEFTNVEFVCADAEEIEYRDLVSGDPVQMVASNLCLSDPIIARASRALDPEGLLVFEAIHVSQWQETGVSSRFAYREEDLAERLLESGFRIEYLAVEEDALRLRGKREFLQSPVVSGPLRQKWEKDGRWSRLLVYFEGGGRSFTARGHVIVKAVKERNRTPQRRCP